MPGKCIYIWFMYTVFCSRRFPNAEQTFGPFFSFLLFGELIFNVSKWRGPWNLEDSTIDQTLIVSTRANLIKNHVFERFNFDLYPIIRKRDKMAAPRDEQRTRWKTQKLVVFASRFITRLYQTPRYEWWSMRPQDITFCRCVIYCLFFFLTKDVPPQEIIGNNQLCHPRRSPVVAQKHCSHTEIDNATIYAQTRIYTAIVTSLRIILNTL